MSTRNLNASVYDAEVQRRLGHIRWYLHSFQQGQPASVMVPLWNLRALTDMSRQAGHADLAQLCAWLERCIMTMQAHQDADPTARIAEIDCVCEYIEQRAHTAANGRETLRLEPMRELAAAGIA